MARLFFTASGEARSAAYVYGLIAAMAVGGLVALVLIAFTLYGFSTRCSKPKSDWVNPLPAEATVVDRSSACELRDRYEKCWYRVDLDVPGSSGSAVREVARHYGAEGYRMLELSDGSWVNGTDGSGDDPRIDIATSDRHGRSVVVSASRMIDGC